MQSNETTSKGLCGPGTSGRHPPPPPRVCSVGGGGVTLLFYLTSIIQGEPYPARPKEPPHPHGGLGHSERLCPSLRCSVEVWGGLCHVSCTQHFIEVCLV